MINTLKIYHELSKTMSEQSAKKLAEVIGAMYEDLLNTVTKKDFDGLKDIVSRNSWRYRRGRKSVPPA